MKKNLTIVPEEIYSANAAKGFWAARDPKNSASISQILLLIVSELTEANEALRKNKFANIDGFRKRMDEVDFVFNPKIGMTKEDQEIKLFKEMFELYIKDSFEDEVADALIRIGDMIGGLNLTNMQSHIDLKLKYNSFRKYKHGKAF